MNLSEFSWEIASPTPWADGTLVYFDFDDSRVYMAVPVQLDQATARQVSHFLRNFSLIAHYCGMRNTISRITQLYVGKGDPLDESWLKALLAVQMTVLGTNSLTTPFLYHYSQFIRQNPATEFFCCEISSLHGWSLHETADYFLRDLLPQLQQQGGYPFEEITELADQAQTVRSHFLKIAEFFSDDKNPYFHLSELPIDEKQEVSSN